MSIEKPFHRNYREIILGENSSYSDWAYIVDHDYSQSPEHYTRAFLMIQKDLVNLFEYIEPCDENLSTHSYRIHELFMRTCIEIEANFKAILRENIYTPIDKKNVFRKEKNWNINDYEKINVTHHLDDYIVTLPIWSGVHQIFKPFFEWKNKETLKWYQAYNSSKHDRQLNFKQANFENLIQSITALFVLLSAQFRTESFVPGEQVLGITTDSYYSGVFGIGGLFMIQFPNNWSQDDKYDFNWSELKNEKDKFNKINYNII